MQVLYLSALSFAAMKRDDRGETKLFMGLETHVQPRVTRIDTASALPSSRSPLVKRGLSDLIFNIGLNHLLTGSVFEQGTPDSPLSNIDTQPELF